MCFIIILDQWALHADKTATNHLNCHLKRSCSPSDKQTEWPNRNATPLLFYGNSFDILPILTYFSKPNQTKPIASGVHSGEWTCETWISDSLTYSSASYHRLGQTKLRNKHKWKWNIFTFYFPHIDNRTNWTNESLSNIHDPRIECCIFNSIYKRLVQSNCFDKIFLNS